MSRNQDPRHRAKGRAARPPFPSHLPRLLTVLEVAVALKVGPETAKRWAYDKGVRRCRTPGGHLRFYAEDVEALLQVAGQ